MREKKKKTFFLEKEITEVSKSQHLPISLTTSIMTYLEKRKLIEVQNINSCCDICKKKLWVAARVGNTDLVLQFALYVLL